MEQVLTGLPLNMALIYLDDVLVAGKTFSDQLSHLCSVLQRLRNAGLKLAPEKCFLLQKEVKYLGHVINEKGITTDPDKIEAVKHGLSQPMLRNCVATLDFAHIIVDSLRVCGCCATTLQVFGGISVWNAAADDAFRKLKNLLTVAPVLGYPTMEDPFVLDTDASLNGVGAVLSQVQNGQERALNYYSHRLSKAERYYCVTRRELLAIVKAIRRFHPYLYGRSFIIRTDHAALRWLLNLKCPEGQIARWLQELQQYDFVVEYRRRVRHNNADALSRRPCLLDRCKYWRLRRSCRRMVNILSVLMNVFLVSLQVMELRALL